jgi:tRNA(Arg) A34 adenosine deaminase TadA
MCVGAIWWARIDRVYYANLLTDAEKLGMDIDALKHEVSVGPGERARPYERLLGEEAFAVVKKWFDETQPDVI